MADLSPEEKRRYWFHEAKRRAAERRGETYDPEAADVAATAEPAPAPAEPRATATEAPASETPPAQAEAAPVTAAAVVPEVPATPVASEAPQPATQPVPAPRSSPARPVPAAPARPAATGTQDKTFSRTDIRTLTRREFLSYTWAAALGVVSVQSLVATGLLMYPRFRAGEFGGDFLLGSVTGLPSQTASPQGDPIGKFWLVNTEEGPKALYMVCTHLGCLYKWAEANNRFECPCHGSMFTREGEFIKGPAPRGLDQFVVEIQENGTVISATETVDGKIQPPAVTSETAEIVIKTGRKIQGPLRS